MAIWRPLNHRIGVFLYLFLRNDWSWSILTEEEKFMIRSVNRSFNAEREDYAKPELYGTGRMEQGENWDSSISRGHSDRGRALIAVLGRVQPRTVLEVGPGAGFFTRAACELASVRRYVGLDVGAGFLDYLRPRLQRIATIKPGFSFDLVQGELSGLGTEKFDFLLILSCVHHVPDRVELFREVAKRLEPGAHVFCFDPSHYLSRIIRLVRGAIFGGYLSPAKFMKRENLSTHHFCTSGEYRRILREVPDLELVEEYFVPAQKARRIPGLASLFPRLVSVEMGVLLRKRLS